MNLKRNWEMCLLLFIQSLLENHDSHCSVQPVPWWRSGGLVAQFRGAGWGVPGSSTSWLFPQPSQWFCKLFDTLINLFLLLEWDFVLSTLTQNRSNKYFLKKGSNLHWLRSWGSEVWLLGFEFQLCPLPAPWLYFFLFIYYFKNRFIYFYLLIFGCVGSSLLCVGFL